MKSILPLFFFILSAVTSAPTLLAQSSVADKGARPTSQPVVAYAKRALQGFGTKLWISNQMTLGQQAHDDNILLPVSAVWSGVPGGLGDRASLRRRSVVRRDRQWGEESFGGI